MVSCGINWRQCRPALEDEQTPLWLYLLQRVKAPPMSTPSAKLPDSDPIMERLEDQVAWYDRKSLASQRAYKRIKITEILAAAIIPFLAALRRPDLGMVTAGLGVLVTVLEGMLHLNQYQQNWINYRSTCEALKHEKYTYLGKAVPIPMFLIRMRCSRNASSHSSRKNTPSGHQLSGRNRANSKKAEVGWESAKGASTLAVPKNPSYTFHPRQSRRFDRACHSLTILD